MGKNKFFFAIVFLGLLPLSACHNLNDGDHLNVEGLRVLLGDQQIVQVMQGQTTGSITIQAGQAAEFQVQFLDPAGQVLDVSGLDADYSLAWEIGHPATLAVSAVPGNRWAFSAQGLQAGQTSLVLLLMHGNHSDFRTPAVNVQVTG